jgi:hypothetical protein
MSWSGRSAVIRRRSDWARYGVLVLLAVVALLCRVDPHSTRTGTHPAPDPNAPTSGWTQLPSAEDNCNDTLAGPAGNAMRILISSGTGPDECAGGEMWSPTQAAVVIDPELGRPGG